MRLLTYGTKKGVDLTAIQFGESLKISSGAYQSNK